MRPHTIRTFITTLGILTTLACAPAARATVFGQVSTAYTLRPGTTDVGGFVSVFESSTLVFGQFRRGFMSIGDFGVQAGFVDPEVGDMGLALGGDVKFMLFQTGAEVPFDLALGPRFAYLDLDLLSLTSIGGSVVISRDYALAQGSLAPYAAFNMRLENVNFDDDPAAALNLAAAAQQYTKDGSDLEVSGIAGARWNISELLDILGEVVFDRDIGFTLGMNFKL
ncbi:MAG TPA: hypothetical protein VNN55_04065 [bacterium]|nr:hypothetical protein [bacterium]